MATSLGSLLIYSLTTISRHLGQSMAGLRNLRVVMDDEDQRSCEPFEIRLAYA